MMEITIDMIEQVLDATDGDYRQIKQALVDADGDVDQAIEAVKAAQAEAAAKAEEEAAKAAEAAAQDETIVDIDEFRTAGATDASDAGAEAGPEAGAASEETPNPDKKNDWTTDEFAEEMVDKIKKRVQEGNVDHIRITKGDKTLLDIPVNVGIIGSLIGMVAIPWAMVLGVIAAYGMNCKVEIVKKDGTSEEM